MDEKNKRYWFKRKRYGWGWTPVTWEGWAIIVLPVVAIILVSTFMPADPVDTSLWQVLLFFGVLYAAMATILFVSLKKGPKPKWRWGRSDNDDPDEDF